jgi:hypothetical protein
VPASNSPVNPNRVPSFDLSIALRRVLLGALAALLIAVLASACGDDGGSATTTTSGPVDTTGATVIEVGYTGGSITGGGKRSAVLGKPVVITVTSDATDEIHVHGYDKSADVRAGAPATITFVADKPGVFEVELHEKGLKLFELEVK